MEEPPVRRVASTPASLADEVAETSSGRRVRALRKTWSEAGLSLAAPNASHAAMRDLPYLALPGLESRVSSRSNLSEYMELTSPLEAGESHALTWPLLRACAASAIGAFVCGLHLGDLNTSAGCVPHSPPVPVPVVRLLSFGLVRLSRCVCLSMMRETLGIPQMVREAHGLAGPSALNDSLWGLCVSTIAIGALVGTVFADRFAAWRGRRAAIGVAAAIFIFAALLHASVAVMMPKLVGSCVVPPIDAAYDPAAAARDLPLAPPFAPAPPAAPPRPPPHAHPPPHSRQRHAQWSSVRSSSNPPPCAPLLSLLVLSRALAGVAVGLCSSVLPVYLGELAPPQLRGSVGAAVAVASSVGVGATHLLGIVLNHDSSGRWLWTLQPLCAALLACVQLIMLHYLPESPVWLLACGSVRKAAEELAALRGYDVGSVDIADEIDLMAQSAHAMAAGAPSHGGREPDDRQLPPLGVQPRGRGGYRPPALLDEFFPGAPPAAEAPLAGAAPLASVAPSHTASFESVDLLSLGPSACSSRLGSADRSTERRLDEPVLAPNPGSGAPTGELTARLLHAATATSKQTDGQQEPRGRPRWSMALCVCLMWAQQLSGVGFATSYSLGLLREMGVGTGWAIAGVVLNDVASIGVTALAVRILDVTGRRPLLLGSLVATAGALVALTAGLKLTAHDASPVGAPLACAALAVHAAAFGVGLGPVPWLLPNELLDVGEQKAAGRLTAASHWLASAFCAQTFLPIVGALGPACLLPNVSLLLLVLLVAVFAPETRGKTIEEVQRELEAAD